MTLPLACALHDYAGRPPAARPSIRRGSQLVQSKLQAPAGCSSGLAAGSEINTTNLNTEATKYLTANFNGYLGATIMNTSATATNASNSAINNLSATATLPSTFLEIIGIKTMDRRMRHRR